MDFKTRKEAWRPSTKMHRKLMCSDRDENSHFHEADRIISWCWTKGVLWGGGSLGGNICKHLSRFILKTCDFRQRCSSYGKNQRKTSQHARPALREAVTLSRNGAASGSMQADGESSF